MEYVSADETAKKWGIGKRQVQTLLANGRISGAKKYGRVWMIPSDEKKPSDLRRKENFAEDSTQSDWQLYEQCGVSYFIGDFERSKKCYREASDGSKAKIRIASVAIGAAISTGDYPFYLEIENYLNKVIENTNDKYISASAQLSLSFAYISAFASRMIPEWLINGDFSCLDESEYMDAIYMRAKYFHTVGDYPSMLAVAQTALCFCNSENASIFPGTYLKLICATAAMRAQNTEAAAKYIESAMSIGLPQGFIIPFAETLHMFDGLVEKLLIKEYPKQADAIKSQWKESFSNWMKFHNLFTKDKITLMLSLREYQIATLAAQGIPNKEIASRLHLSLSRQKGIMKDIYAILCINNRKELSQYILNPQKNDTF